MKSVKIYIGGFPDDVMKDIDTGEYVSFSEKEFYNNEHCPEQGDVYTVLEIKPIEMVEYSLKPERKKL